MENDQFELVELNVGGVHYTTTVNTLHQAEPDSLLASIISAHSNETFARDSNNRIFLDRDGQLFRFVLDYLRNKKILLPDNFNERERLRVEADYYRLTGLSQLLAAYRYQANVNGKTSSDVLTHLTASTNSIDLSASMSNARAPPRSTSGYIVIGYRGTFGELKGRKRSEMRRIQIIPFT